MAERGRAVVSGGVVEGTSLGRVLLVGGSTLGTGVGKIGTLGSETGADAVSGTVGGSFGVVGGSGVVLVLSANMSASCWSAVCWLSVRGESGDAGDGFCKA